MSITFMRHGERRDSDLHTVAEADPPLTERGKKDVAKAAENLKKTLGPEVAQKAVVVSSPFLRCRQTAQELLKNDVGDKQRDILLDWSVCEVYGPLRIKNGEQSDVCQGLNNIAGTKPQWKESIEQATRRYRKAFTQLGEHSEHVIVVTHGDALSAVLTKFFPKLVLFRVEFLAFITFSRVQRGLYKLLKTEDLEWFDDGHTNLNDTLVDSNQRRILDGNPSQERSSAALGSRRNEGSFKDNQVVEVRVALSPVQSSSLAREEVPLLPCEGRTRGPLKSRLDWLLRMLYVSLSFMSFFAMKSKVYAGLFASCVITVEFTVEFIPKISAVARCIITTSKLETLSLCRRITYYLSCTLVKLGSALLLFMCTGSIVDRVRDSTPSNVVQTVSNFLTSWTGEEILVGMGGLNIFRQCLSVYRRRNADDPVTY